MRVIEPAEGVRQRMDRTEPALESGGAHGRGDEHVAARIEIAPLLHRLRQVLLDQPHAFERHALRQRMIERRAVGLEAVGERIHAGRRGQLRRQPDGELGIEDRHLRHDRRMEDDLLLVRLGMRDDAGAADFRSRARRRRHGDDGRDHAGIGARPPVVDVFEIEDRNRLAVHQRDQLADIEAGTAAERDDAVVMAALERL